jgi:peptide/nickel transport system substrate-binding protein
VKFHDGSAFTADDVIFTIDRVPNVPNSPNSFAQFTRGIESVKKIDDHTIVVKTKAPNPQLLSDFANIFIVQAKAAKGATTRISTPARRSSAPAPYKLVKFVTGELLEVERFDAYWGGKQPGRR